MVKIDAGATFTNNSAKLNAKVSGQGSFNLEKIPTGPNFIIDGIATIDILRNLDIAQGFQAGTANINANVNIMANADVTIDRIIISNNQTLRYKAGDLAVNNYISGAGSFSHEVADILPKIGAAGNPLATLNLAGVEATKHSISGDVYATTTNVAVKNELAITAATKFDGSVNLADASILTLGTNILTLTGDFAAAGEGLIINSTLNSATQYGKISAAKTRLAGKNITVNFDGSYNLKDGSVIQLFSNLDEVPKLFIKGTSKLNKITMQADGSLLFAFDVIEAAVVRTDVSKIMENLEGHGEFNSLMDHFEDLTGEANLLATQISRLDLKNPEHASLAKDVVRRAYSNTTAVTSDIHSANISGCLSIISNVASSSLVTGGGSYGISSPATVTGVASGDEDGLYRSGVWVQGFGSQAIQKLAKNRPGYKSTSIGGVIGVDTLVNDYFRVGVAGIHADSNVKMRDYKRGDKVNAKSWMMSIYGVYEINQNLYTRAIATFGNTNVTTNENKPIAVIGATGTISTGEYTSQSYSVDSAVGYRHNLSENVAIIPEVGLRANLFIDGGYTEIGGVSNRIITKKSGANYLAIVGATVSSNLMLGEAEFSPSLHARIMQDIGGRSPEVTSKINGSFVAQTTKNKAISKTSFQTGFDLSTRYGMMEYGVGYDANISKKFISHSGALKVRINF